MSVEMKKGDSYSKGSTVTKIYFYRNWKTFSCEERAATTQRALITGSEEMLLASF